MDYDMGALAKPLHIDIPVTLREVRTVFSIERWYSKETCLLRFFTFS